MLECVFCGEDLAGKFVAVVIEGYLYPSGSFVGDNGNEPVYACVECLNHAVETF